MKKRLLAAFACLCMLLTLLPAAVFAGEGEGDPGAGVWHRIPGQRMERQSDH